MASKDGKANPEMDAKGTLPEPETETDKNSFAESKRTRIFVAICYVVCCLIWGTTWYAIRISIEPGDGFPPNFAGAIRFVIAILLYVPLWLIFSKKIRRPSKAEIAWVSLAGFLNGLYQCFMYCCELTISGGLAAVIMATSPLMVALIAICTGLEKVRRQTIWSFCICLFGVALVCYDRMHASSEQLFGISLALCGAFFTSISNITLKGRGSKLHPIASATIFLIATDIPVWIASIACGEKPVLWPLALAPALSILYMAVMSSILAFSLYLYMIRHISLMAISTLPFVLPVLALVVDMFFEKRVTLSPQVWTGIAIVLSGVVLSVRRF